MELDRYQVLAEVTMDRTRQQGRDALANGALGIAGEAGEVADAIKKHLFHGHALDVEGLRDELGDVLWYVATLAKTLGLSLDDVAAANVAKLKARYPEGFDPARSRARDVAAEGSASAEAEGGEAG